MCVLKPIYHNITSVYKSVGDNQFEMEKVPIISNIGKETNEGM